MPPSALCLLALGCRLLRGPTPGDVPDPAVDARAAEVEAAANAEEETEAAEATAVAEADEAEPEPEPEPAAATATPDDDGDDDEAPVGEDDGDAGPVPVDPGPPPRIDGPYVGGILGVGVGLVRVNDLSTGPFTSFGGALRFGEYVLPWLGLGLSVGGGGGVRSQDGARQQLGQGQLAVEFNFVPAPKRLDLQLRGSFGFGGGAVREAGRSGRAGFGGAMFGAAARYEWFPFAAKRRPYRGGGFGLGPELGWIGFTPAAAGRPMSNTIYLALALTFYFGS